jgi:ribose transport system substrate-binding protein
MRVRSNSAVATWIAVLGAAGVVTACGSGGKSSTTQASAGSGKDLTVGGVVFNPADPYWISMKCGAQSAAKKLGVKLNWQASPTPDVGPETQALNSVAVTSPDGIMLAPDSPTAFVSPVQTLMHKGVPVVIVDSALSSDAGLKNVLTDQSQDGAVLAPVIAREIGSHGTLGIISDKPGAPGAIARFKPLVDLLHKQAPGIKVLPIQYQQEDSSAGAAQLAEGLIRGNPGLSAIYAINGPLGIGVASGVKAANAASKVKVFSFDATPQEVTGVRNGTFTAIIGQSPFLEGSTAVQTLVTYLRAHGKGAVSPQSPYVVHTPVKLITKDNVDLPATKRFFYAASC